MDSKNFEAGLAALIAAMAQSAESKEVPGSAEGELDFMALDLGNGTTYCPGSSVICLIATEQCVLLFGDTVSSGLQMLYYGSVKLPMLDSRDVTLGMVSVFEPFVDDGLYVFTTETASMFVEVVDGKPFSYTTGSMEDPGTLGMQSTEEMLKGLGITDFRYLGTFRKPAA